VGACRRLSRKIAQTPSYEADSEIQVLPTQTEHAVGLLLYLMSSLVSAQGDFY
jgi:hypothetical protein